MTRTSGQNDHLAADRLTSVHSEQMTVEEIVARYGVSERTARRHRARGTLPSDDRRATYRLGKVITFPARSPLAKNSTHAWKHLIVARNALRKAANSARLEHCDLALALEIYGEVEALTSSWGQKELPWSYHAIP